MSRHHGVGEVSRYVELIPTSFPELPKPFRNPANCQQPTFCMPMLCRTGWNESLINPINPFKGPYFEGPRGCLCINEPVSAQTLILVNLHWWNLYVFWNNSAPSRSWETISRQILPIITPDLPIPARSLNSIIRPELLNLFFYIKPTTNFTTISFWGYNPR